MMTGQNAFFYGTLMHPRILRRVIGNDGSHLEVCPAVLLEHTRHKVKYRDYPGVIPYSQARIHLGRELTPEERVVRGTLVMGLTEEDMAWIDEFEDSEYTRKAMTVYSLGPPIELTKYGTDVASLIPHDPPAIPEDVASTAGVLAETYIYVDYRKLRKVLWDWKDFVENRAVRWFEEE